MRRFHLASAVAIIVSVSLAQGDGPTSAPSPSPPVDDRNRVAVTIYVPGLTWDERGNATFPFVVECAFPTESRLIGRKVLIEDHVDHNGGKLAQYLKKGHLPDHPNLLYITYEPIEPDGQPSTLFHNGLEERREFTIAAGSNFQKFTVGKFDVPSAKSINMRAYLVVAGNLVAESGPVQVAISRGRIGREE